jgi:gas vesicle protein
MNVTHPRSRSRRGAVALVLALALVGAGCGDSPEDNAHDSGKDVGQALRAVTAAGDADQLQAAIAELKDAVSNVSDDVSARVRDQASVQSDTINKAVDNAKTALTASDPSQASEARDEVQAQVQDLRSQASGFADSNDSVTNAFWDGVKDGYDD